MRLTTPIERNALLTLLSSDIGYVLEVGLLYATQFEDGTFGVGQRFTEPLIEHRFSTAAEAVDFFLELRDTHQLGYDWERWLCSGSADRQPVD